MAPGALLERPRQARSIARELKIAKILMLVGFRGSAGTPLLY
jgi:hypothetical protein